MGEEEASGFGAGGEGIELDSDLGDELGHHLDGRGSTREEKQGNWWSGCDMNLSMLRLNDFPKLEVKASICA